MQGLLQCVKLLTQRTRRVWPQSARLNPQLCWGVAACSSTSQDHRHVASPAALSPPRELARHHRMNTQVSPPLCHHHAYVHAWWAAMYCHGQHKEHQQKTTKHQVKHAPCPRVHCPRAACCGQGCSAGPGRRAWTELNGPQPGHQTTLSRPRPTHYESMRCRSKGE